MKNFSYSAAVGSVRFLLAAWIGAAVLFVITSVAEQTSPSFDSVTRDQLATVRFPLYYRFGFASLIAAVGCCGLAVLTAKAEQRRKWMFVGIVAAISLAMMWADYLWIYVPLQESITPPGKARTQEFLSLHTWSRYANETHIGFAMFAAVMSCLDGRSHLKGQEKAENTVS